MGAGQTNKPSRSLRFMIFIASLAIPFLLENGFAQEVVHSPPLGDPLRQTLMNALRVPVEKELKKRVIFKINLLNVIGRWAFIRGVPLQPGGTPMDYRGTKYQKEIIDGIFDDQICALLHEKKGRWRVIDYRIGGTDVCFPGDFDYPKSILYPPQK